MKGYRKLRKYVLETLEKQLSPKLVYHGYHHTMDVIKACNAYIRRLGISREEAYLLRIGALFHDMGFINTYKNHEEEGVRIAKDLMPKYGFTNGQIEVVSGLIMATKVPQNPKTRLEEIMCDADLDYLGRGDFNPIANSLYDELQQFGIMEDENEWNKLQVKFLEAHTYHTEFAKKNRAPRKAQRIEEIKRIIK